MKKIVKILRRMVVVIIIGLSIYACQDHLDDLRENPNEVTNIDDAALFTKAVRSLFQGTTDVSSSRFTGHYAHYFVAGSTARFPDQYGDGFDQQYRDMFNGMYGGVIRHIEEVLVITSTGETKNDVRNAIANVIAVMGYAKITDGFGDIPYSEGGKGKTEGVLSPKYDTQQSIYTDLITRLSTSINILKNGNSAMGYPFSDPIFDNDLDKWVRFANSMKLRLAMRLRNADNALSKQIVSECLSDPLMEINSHNAFLIETEGNGNAWFSMRTGFPSIKMSKMFIDQLQSTTDPRLSVFVSKDQNGAYSGMMNGLTDASFGLSNFAAKSDMGIALSSKDSKLYVMTAAEVWFLRAEASLAYDTNVNAANENYKMGIETSLNQWNVAASELDGFINSSTAELQGSTNDMEAQIGTQMWIALTPNYYESWSHIRRTGYPVIAKRTGDNLHQGVTNGELPGRFLYSSFELSSNNANVNEAIARQGGNSISNSVWWAKNQ